ncbi:hypothetical protein AB0958_40150 [Streptomyces sp. NPDC006655]|uniref:hypothetical protein n=1 Tax=Streptomyces sp. NPDC006655 TaxID=3156898 RepID=UPI0034533941
MPLPPSSRTRSGVRRRSLIVSAASAAVLAGCSAGPGPGGTTPSVSERARARAARDSRGLLGRYDAVLAAHPALADRLRPLRAEVAAHVAAFEEGTASPTATGSATASASAPTSASASVSASVSTSASTSASASVSTSGSPSAPPSATAPASVTAPPSGSASPAVPADEKAALAWLAAAERSLADQRAKALLEVPGELARLLAGVAAAGAGHAYLLTKGDK